MIIQYNRQKHQIQNHKLQINHNDQNSKQLFRTFEFSALNLFGICNFGFGALFFMLRLECKKN
ncbi:hypothetical protein A2316_00590 [Candidatus Falkowbacteria bacterium RIFOXYB2_FULL_38_15]|uniref:Transmembrane protein n=1 Tax=Candidatus Falkowbacteria bacterium RIFOXYA2_FULL_38_12 TaxID=1797993 RepID=A0A1F5S3L9_9BACT|nr:MAG: hypothetical protein A2257_00085 [Candidatus Falkowbacteria bacterium RIFOXYA2_FULL_38_12]OGF32701.1 MAG: hypothetical protein A2316_00590 [Candidatus Falkowbacteria bacterium RIFOXYB2_FULL_38_15]OGF42263.1 MAG: hypothetical protein A2555_03305 [Candidatus Falkowbacteria bacterium RIFOXYD2_FULL_39_16]